MIYYEKMFDESTGRKISFGEFKEIFTDWDFELKFLTMEEFREEFDNLHCVLNPYDIEIIYIRTPLVERSYSDLEDEYNQVSSEI